MDGSYAVARVVRAGGLEPDRAEVEHWEVSALLERETLLATLAAEAEEGGRLVFVAGEAGVGKSTLVRAFGALVGRRVLRGSCENLATPTPLGPFFDLAAETEGGLGGLPARAADPRTVARAVLAELGRRVVMVIEDVHWADEATLDALRVARPADPPTRRLLDVVALVPGAELLAPRGGGVRRCRSSRRCSPPAAPRGR